MSAGKFAAKVMARVCLGGIIGGLSMNAAHDIAGQNAVAALGIGLAIPVVLAVLSAIGDMMTDER
ncbi:hypothetical protein K6L44_17700 [Gluconacetobacter entanii]|uniref:hypothetical protein n=1 Tax=Gluconacetobacter entanii TaxID=108528 RepID=UPI001C93421C|nr:hypothetical protein [Gluconacetobacter entanii]MBY4641774.1 hypothetical protein [Gluconacetobacter entanii]MCW4581227.1 hypothetical protein [Gluconacetobacter entanii]MCW4584487.1 hypothetical protein [Gluconacetobacter entanii]MCW4587849.1 hypothetical protein [Gluconacetobacter entanii]